MILSTSAIAIRKANFKDARAIGELHAKSWRIAYQGVVHDEFLQKQNGDKRAFQANARLVANQTTILVAEVDQEILKSPMPSFLLFTLIHSFSVWESVQRYSERPRV